MSNYINPTPIPQGDIFEATRQFVLTYALPALEPAHVFQGWRNRVSLPAKTNEYAVISILYNVTHGTATEIYDPEEEKLNLASLAEIVVQVDFCSDGDNARQRAGLLAMVARTSVGVLFMNQFGLSILYADDARDLSFVGDANQFVRRYMTSLHLVGNTGLTVDLPGAMAAEVTKIYPIRRM